MKQVNSAECISCLKCVDVCSVNALKIKFANKDIKPKTFRAVTVYSFLAVMLVIIFTPFWQTKPVTNFIWPDGKINVEDLRWSNTLEYVIEKTKIPFSYFQEKLWLPADMDKKSKLKHIWEDYNVKNKEGQFIEMEEFKEAIKGYESWK
jgi:ferredoxin